MQSLPNYIGISGVMSAEQADKTATLFEQHGFIPGSDHIGMIGFCMNGDKPQDPHFVNRQLPADQLMNAMKGVKDRVLPMVHYEPGRNDSFFAHLRESIQDVCSEGVCKAVQLNGLVAPAEIERVNEYFPDLGVVVQLQRTLLERGNSEVLQYIGDIRNGVNTVLIDPSMGFGTPLDVSEAITLARSIREKYTGLGIAFAGGFGPDNVQSRTQSLHTGLGDNDWSIDTESAVRTDDVLNFTKVDAHLSQTRLGLQN